MPRPADFTLPDYAGGSFRLSDVGMLLVRGPRWYPYAFGATLYPS